MSEQLLSSNDKMTHLWAIFDYTVSRIDSADSKATTTLTINGIVLGFLLVSGFQVATSPTITFNLTTRGMVIFVLGIAGIMAFLYSMICSLLTLTPRTGHRVQFRELIEPGFERPGKTSIYFGAIASISRDKYQEEVTAADSAQMMKDLMSQIHILSHITVQKYKWQDRSFTGLGASFLFLILIIFVMVL